jgi:hypothetical protein
MGSSKSTSELLNSKAKYANSNLHR